MALGKSAATETNLLLLLFNATTWGSYAEDKVTSPHTNLDIALHTASPGDGGTMSTNETAYTGYARGTLARTSGATGFDVTASTVSLGADLDFGECTAAAGGAITHFSIGVTGGGAAEILYLGTVTPNITMAVGVVPRLKTTGTITED